jgi:hypothetical protein
MAYRDLSAFLVALVNVSILIAGARQLQTWAKMPECEKLRWLAEN